MVVKVALYIQISLWYSKHVQHAVTFVRMMYYLMLLRFTHVYLSGIHDWIHDLGLVQNSIHSSDF